MDLVIVMRVKRIPAETKNVHSCMEGRIVEPMTKFFEPFNHITYSKLHYTLPWVASIQSTPTNFQRM
jgi:hypothetical protein